MRTVYQQWVEFRDKIMPADAPPVQREEMRRSFYAGYFAALCTCQDIGEDSVSEEQGVETLQAHHDECSLFFKGLIHRAGPQG